MIAHGTIDPATPVFVAPALILFQELFLFQADPLHLLLLTCLPNLIQLSLDGPIYTIQANHSNYSCFLSHCTAIYWPNGSYRCIILSNNWPKKSKKKKKKIKTKQKKTNKNGTNYKKKQSAKTKQYKKKQILSTNKSKSNKQTKRSQKETNKDNQQHKTKQQQQTNRQTKQTNQTTKTKQNKT